MIPKSSSSAVSPFRRSRDPRGKEQRLIRLSNPNTEGATGFCLDVYDLVLSKYAAGREKDTAFNRALVRYGCVAEAAPNNYRIDRVSGDSSVIARSPCDEAIQGPQHARRQQPRRSYCGHWIASLRSQ